MPARLLRPAALAVCGLAVAAMIAGSVAGSTGVALTAGLISAGAAVCLIAVTAATAGSPGAGAHEDLAAEVERRVAALVAAGAGEAEVRALVAAAVRLGQGRSREARPQEPFRHG